MAKRQARWFVRRDSDSRILCIDGKWRMMAAGVERIKFYSASWRAVKYGLKYQDGTATAVYSDDVVNCCGEVRRGAAA